MAQASLDLVVACRLSLLHGIWDLSPPTGDQICFPCLRRQIPNQWMARKFLEVEEFLKNRKVFLLEKGLLLDLYSTKYFQGYILVFLWRLCFSNSVWI